MLIYPASYHLFAVTEGQTYRVETALDTLFKSVDPGQFIRDQLPQAKLGQIPITGSAMLDSQEIWAAGVTYYRSMNARMEESKDAGGGTFYDRVYQADRPELFFKATKHRVACPGEPVRIRDDSKWNVPEPELTLAINTRGRIFGYTIGNDMSSRDIEGENPLYLPQAKVYDRSAAIGPAILITDEVLEPSTTIELEIRRDGTAAFTGSASIDQIKRSLPSLVEYLFRDNSFPAGCYLMTGTGIVPPDDFTLKQGDEVRITIEPIGTLINPVA